jgi:BirA family biotin operon repressor/biotin-[acetyl-CoA-carboxylase] ligase
MLTILLDAIDSTQAEALRRWEAGDVTPPAVVVAREQTAGRGTGGRSWISQPGGLYVSVLDKPTGRFGPDSRRLVLAGALATAVWLADRFGVRAAIKPLNDLYARGRKLGGVLVEARAEAGVLQVAITGIGVNLSTAPRELAGEVAAISLAELGVAETELADLPYLARELGERVIAWNRLALSGDEKLFDEAWGRFGLPGAELSTF